jgi:hypothetical protein
MISSIIIYTLIFLGNLLIMKRKSIVVLIKITILSLISAYPVLASK